MERLFHERFSNTAKEAPDRPALRDEQGTLTYGETDDMSSALAEGLLQDGLCPGEAVAVLVSRQKEIEIGRAHV